MIPNTSKILSDEEIETFLEIYYSSPMLPEKERQNLKNCFNALFRPLDHDFLKKLCPRGCDPLQSYFVEYTQGAFCTPHIDINNNLKTKENLGVYTTTTYLSAPDEYEGGESVLYSKDMKSEKCFKPNKGETLLINPLQNHSVKMVTKGSRIVHIGWYLSQTEKYLVEDGVILV